ncbi:hypothetical protein ATCV1_z343L [Acanthocystis turfacea chlorella virus 1]|uniref:Uncharacterized protein z343L n=1 Tax=Chlorovirus heliozoae TaxID=322019 RepID=A7K8V3_9PHYC|nr:hypothetical protein ATCV1_z343L [Acanthocystis turfacea chlorella virus 1]ABT16477.1 hypothetical protein ATCV1_z343L [Acanthocystis turfacea chlorella virus 1]
MEYSAASMTNRPTKNTASIADRPAPRALNASMRSMLMGDKLVTLTTFRVRRRVPRAGVRNTCPLPETRIVRGGNIV